MIQVSFQLNTAVTIFFSRSSSYFLFSLYFLRIQTLSQLISNMVSEPITSSNLKSNTYNFVTSIKLYQNNFIVWRTQVLTSIKSNGLEGFITGTKSVQISILFKMKLLRAPQALDLDQELIILSSLHGSELINFSSVG